MTKRIDVLEHGYVRLLGTWGSDARALESARNILEDGFVGAGAPRREVDDDALVRALWTSKPPMPFAMPEASFEAVAPLFVLYDWLRPAAPEAHERVSGRIVEMLDLQETTSGERPAGGRRALREEGSGRTRSFAGYRALLAAGVEPDLARGELPRDTYGRVGFSGSLCAWLAFLSRGDTDPSSEVNRAFFRAFEELLTGAFPRSLAAARGAHPRPAEEP